MMTSEVERYFLLRSRARRQVGVALERRQQVLEPVEDDAEAVLDRPHAERDRQVRLADAGRPLDQERAVLADPLAGRQRLDAAALERRLEGEVEVGQRLSGRQPREHERGPHPPLVALAQLVLEQPVEEAVRRQSPRPPPR